MIEDGNDEFSLKGCSNNILLKLPSLYQDIDHYAIYASQVFDEIVYIKTISITDMTLVIQTVILHSKDGKLLSEIYVFIYKGIISKWTTRLVSKICSVVSSYFCIWIVSWYSIRAYILIFLRKFQEIIPSKQRIFQESNKRVFNE